MFLSPCPAYLIYAELIILVTFGYEIGSFSSCIISPRIIIISFFLGPYIVFSFLFSDIPSLCLSLHARDHVSHPHEITG
jgi:hypothetical protein